MQNVRISKDILAALSHSTCKSGKFPNGGSLAQLFNEQLPIKTRFIACSNIISVPI